MTNEATEYAIGGGNNTFIDKQNVLFQQLNDAERSLKRDREVARIELICDSPGEIENHKTASMKKFRGKESIFKRPEAPISQCLQSRGQPGYKRNPNKWTKYSLEDISYQDMSERSNTSAAFTFLREMEDRRDSLNIDRMDVDIPFNKILFNKGKNKEPKYNKSVQIKINDSSKDSSEANSSFKSTKVIMPEYVVGQPIKKNKKKKSLEKSSPKKELKLLHLIEINDDDETNDNDDKNNDV